MIKSRRFWKIPAMLVVGLALVLTGCDSDISPDTGWQVRANDDQLTTALIFEFNAPVDNLTMGEISITPSGIAAGSTLVGAGRKWTLYTNVETDGEITVTINRRGVSSRPTTLEVGTIGWGATLTGNIVNLTFDAAIDNLVPADIIFVTSTGAVINPVSVTSHTNDGRHFEVEFWNPGGTLRLIITRPGVSSTPLTFTGANPALDYSVTFVTNPTRGTSLEFDFGSRAVTDLTLNQISVIDGTGSVTQSTLRRVNATGTIWELDVTVIRAGTVLVSINRPDYFDEGSTNLIHQVAVYFGTSVTVLPVNRNTSAAWAGRRYETQYLEFEFTTPVNLTLANIFINPIDRDEGFNATATLGNLVGSGTHWRLEINITPESASGDMRGRLYNIPGMEPANINAAYEWSVSVVRNTALTNVTVGAINDDGNRPITFNFSHPVVDPGWINYLTATDHELTGIAGTVMGHSDLGTASGHTWVVFFSFTGSSGAHNVAFEVEGHSGIDSSEPGIPSMLTTRLVRSVSIPATPAP